MKFSKANKKLQKLAKVPAMQEWLVGNRKIYSFDLPAGHTCPAANICFAKAVQSLDGKWRIQDGKNMTVRCYAASEEVIFPAVRNLRWHNLNSLRDNRILSKYELLNMSLPHNAGIVRIHSSGDFFNYDYWHAWCKVALKHPHTLFYTYTKNGIKWMDKPLPINFVVTASYGGKYDSLIKNWGLRSATIVESIDEAKKLGLQIDYNDSCAANPTHKHFALLIHGNGPAGSTQAKLHNEVIRKGGNK